MLEGRGFEPAVRFWTLGGQLLDSWAAHSSSDRGCFGSCKRVATNSLHRGLTGANRVNRRKGSIPSGSPCRCARGHEALRYLESAFAAIVVYPLVNVVPGKITR